MNSHISQVQIVEWINLNLANRQILHKTYLQRKGTSTHQLSRLLSFASFSYFWMVRSSTWPLKNNICPPAVDLPASGTMKQRKIRKHLRSIIYENNYSTNTYNMCLPISIKAWIKDKIVPLLTIIVTSNHDPHRKSINSIHVMTQIILCQTLHKRHNNKTSITKKKKNAHIWLRLKKGWKKASSKKTRLTNMANENHIQMALCFLFLLYYLLSILMCSNWIHAKVRVAQESILTGKKYRCNEQW